MSQICIEVKKFSIACSSFFCEKGRGIWFDSRLNLANHFQPSLSRFLALSGLIIKQSPPKNHGNMSLSS